MKCLIFQAPWPIFVHDIYPRKNLHLSWSMSLKSSTVRCLSDGAVNVPRNCWKRTFNKLISSNFPNGTFEVITITVTEIVLILVFFTFGSKKKTKMKTGNTVAPSYHYLSDNSSLPNLVNVKGLHENSKWILCVSNRAEWWSVRLRTKWFWNRFPLQLLKLQISRLFPARSSLTFR